MLWRARGESRDRREQLEDGKKQESECVVVGAKRYQVSEWRWPVTRPCGSGFEKSDKKEFKTANGLLNKRTW